MLTRLKMARQAMGVKQEIMAHKLGTKQPFYSQLENGKLNAAMLPEDTKQNIVKLFGEPAEKMLQPVQFRGLPKVKTLLAEAN